MTRPGIVSVLEGTGLAWIALGAWCGFLLLMAVDNPERLRAARVADPRRIRQLHLDLIIMGVLMTTVAAAVPRQTVAGASLVLFGGVTAPLTFLWMAFSTTAASTFAFKAISMASFVALCAGLTAAFFSWLA